MARRSIGHCGLSGADDGGFYPSTAYGRLTSTSIFLPNRDGVANWGTSVNCVVP